MMKIIFIFNLPFTFVSVFMFGFLFGMIIKS